MSFKPIYKLRDSVKNFESYLSFISANPLAVNFVEKNLNYFIWTIFLYGNPNAVHLIEDRFKKLDPSQVSFHFLSSAEQMASLYFLSLDLLFLVLANSQRRRQMAK